MPTGPSGKAIPGPWISAGALADWVFCPRAYFFHEHPPPPGEAYAAFERRSAGRQYHQEYLGRELSASEGSAGLWLLGAIGLILLVAAVVLVEIG